MFSSSVSVPLTAGAHLVINLAALQHNWHCLQTYLKPSVTSCAAALKANAYGLGMEQVGRALFSAGCRSFFVALPEEGLQARKLFPEATIYVLNGLFKGCASLYAQAGMRPVLNTLQEITEWTAYCRQQNRSFPAALHSDTGFHRLGLSYEETCHFFSSTAYSGVLRPCLLMSHLACADTPDHPLNKLQLQRFKALRAQIYHASPNLGMLPCSLANSAALLFLPETQFDLPRPGIVLYGGMLNTADSGPEKKQLPQFKTVASLQARLLQIRQAQPGETIGYGATYTFSKPTLIGIASVGYGDGYHRSASSSTLKPGAYGWCAGHRVPVLGRVSMDLTAFDLSALPSSLEEKTEWIEIFGPHIPLETLAAWQGTIPYEILTQLGARLTRSYISFTESEAVFS